MKKIIVASRNPVKVEAVRNGFQRLFPLEVFEYQSVSVDSGVADQPMSDEAARRGAVTRAQNARKAYPNGTYWVGVEGGCDYLDDGMFAFAWIIVLADDRMGRARTAVFRLPREVQALVDSGLELGDADDQVFGRKNSKQKSGAVGLLTGDVITRTTLYEQAVILALLPFVNPSLY
jgi:inosine/xanthosine triphosphatase